MAEMQFARGKTETVVPEVRLTKARDGQSGTALFYFEKPEALCNNDTAEVTGLYLLDEEGEIVTRDVKAKFVNGQPSALEVVLKLQSVAEWDRFMRFMNRYAEANGLGFSKSAEDA